MTPNPLTFPFPSSPYLTLHPTLQTGRSLFAQTSIPANTLIHTSSSPYTSTIYKEFRKEICAWCFAYDGTTRKGWKITGGGGGERFCSEECKGSCVREGQKANGIRERVQGALDDAIRRLQKLKLKHQQQPLVFHDMTPLTLETKSFDTTWQKAESQDVVNDNDTDAPLDGLELDMARFVGSALAQHHIHIYTSQSSHSHSHPSDPILFLQSNELGNITERPYILPTHLRIYSFLRSALSNVPEMKTYFGGGENGAYNWVRALLNRDIGNSFGIWEQVDAGEKDIFGWGIWLDASFFNHSTHPVPTHPIASDTLGRLHTQRNQTPYRSYISFRNDAGYRTR